MTILIFASILKAVVTWLVILYVGTNLIGMVGRGIFEKPLVSGNHLVTFISTALILAVCFYVYMWWGILFLAPVILVMVSRIPDLYWEVRVLPKELDMQYPVPKDLIKKALKAKSRNASFWDYFFTSLDWIALIILFIAFFTAD